MIQGLREKVHRVTDEFAEKYERQKNTTAKLQRE